MAASRAEPGRAVTTADRYDRVGELLVAALDRPAAERESYLEEACRGDALLRREVETLLRSHDAAGGFLSGTALSAMGLVAESEPEPEERQVGPYRFLEEIGRGGMGVVYLAIRSDEAFEKKVAVKLVKRGMDTEEIVRRFEKERRILAALDHPNIARILDGGTTGDGLP
jgi:serine/threonine protein kinase